MKGVTKKSPDKFRGLTLIFKMQNAFTAEALSGLRERRVVGFV